MASSQSRRRCIGIFIAAVLIMASFVLPLPQGLSPEGLSSIAILLAAITLWICGSFPEALTCLLMICIASWVGIADLATLFSKVASSSFFFIFATFSITAAIESTTLPRRFVQFIMRISRGNPSLIILGTMFGCGLFASVMSHIAATSLFAAFGLMILRQSGDPEPGTSNFARGLMIGIGYGAGFGGFAMPVGTVNVLAVEIISSTLQIDIRFIEWMSVGIPLWIIGTLIAWLSVIACFPPEKLIAENAPAMGENMPQEKLTPREWKVLIIIASIFIFWVLSSWLPFINTSAVAIIGMIVMFLPGVDILDWKSYSKCANWNTIFFVGSIGAVIFCITSSGASDWLVGVFTANVTSVSAFGFFLIAAIAGWVCHALIPTGSGVFLMLIVPFVNIALAFGISPIPIVLIIAFWAGLALLLPFDAVPMMTYGYGYYSAADMIKCAVVPSVVLWLLTATLIPWICQICGL